MELCSFTAVHISGNAKIECTATVFQSFYARLAKGLRLYIIYYDVMYELDLWHDISRLATLSVICWRNSDIQAEWQSVSAHARPAPYACDSMRCK